MGSEDKGFLLKMDSFCMNVGGLGVGTQTQPTSLNASMYNKGMRREGCERENGYRRQKQIGAGTIRVMLSPEVY